jgi:hypothetical protein
MSAAYCGTITYARHGNLMNCASDEPQRLSSLAEY